MVKKQTWLIVFVVSTVLVSQSAVAVDTNSDAVDDAVTVSVASAGDQSFPDTDLPATPTASVINFNNCGTSSHTGGASIQAVHVTSGVARTVGTASGGLTCSSDAGVYGGAGGAGGYVTAGSSANRWVLNLSETHTYVSFWWSAGNPDNNIQFLDSSGNPLLSPAFTADSLYFTLFGSTTARCPRTPQSGYCGNPNLTINGTNYASRQVQDEPYAFIHLRFPSGFRQIQMWGTGFEFDNLTLSVTLPPLGGEENVVGALPAYSLTTARVIPVDPRSDSVPFPGVLLSGAAQSQPNATLCLTQVTNSTGTTAVPTGSGNLNISAPATTGVTQSMSPPRFIFTGSQTTVRDLSSRVRIVSSTASRSVASSETVWFRASVQAALNGGDLSCAISGSVVTAFVIELRPIRLNNVNQLGIPLD